MASHFNGPVDSKNGFTVNGVPFSGTPGPNSITESMIQDDAVTYYKLAENAVSSASIVPGGIYATSLGPGTICVSSMQLGPEYLDGEEHQLPYELIDAYAIGYAVIDCMLYVDTGAGTAATIDVGTDENWGIGASDPDGFADGVDIENPTAYRMTTAAVTPSLATGAVYFPPSDQGRLVVKTSSDISSSGASIQLVVIFIKLPM